MDRRIPRMAKTQPMISSRVIRDSLMLPVSTVTITRCLYEANLHVLKRWQFAKEHIVCHVEKCRNILWTDESKIVLFGSKGPRQFYALKTGKRDGANITIFECFSYYGSYLLWFLLLGIMDQFAYITILEEVMLPSVEEEMPLKWVFQQANNPNHTSKRAASWFQTNKIKVIQ
uniref:Transposase Tc1-like domain-containing protein n=1 Tax=Amphilophus citrinellus TaxID=61819 RepID=A0A3Q0RIL2_AMPCI